MSLTKLLRWVLPSFILRWLGYDLFERIGTSPVRELPSDPASWTLADFYAADWIDALKADSPEARIIS